MTPAEDAALTDRLFAGVGAFHRLLGEQLPGARVIEGDGWVGSHVPAARNASLLNSVVPLDDPPKLARALEHIEDEYGPEQKWGVWCDRRDGQTEGFLESAGLVLDSRPVGQGAVLAELEHLDDQQAEPIEPATLGAVNEAAYGFNDGRFADLLRHLTGLVAYGVEGKAVAAYVAHGSDAHVTFVATHPDHRRQGLATRALRAALNHAKQQGLETTTLCASPKGAGVYRAMGYRDLCPVALWEKRPG